MLTQKKIRISAMELIEAAKDELNQGKVEEAITHKNLAIECSVNGDGTTLVEEDCPVMLLIKQIRTTVARYPTVKRLRGQ
jgi:hypothetical protein